MSLQNAYNSRIGKAYPGLPYDMTNKEVISLAAEDGNIRFGAAVVQGTNENAGALPTGAGDFFRGIALREHTKEQRNNAALTPPRGDGEVSYIPQTDSVSVATTGRVWVQVEVAVSAGDTPHFRHTATGAQQLGAWRNDEDTATAAAIPKGKFITDAEAGELAVIDLNLA